LAIFVTVEKRRVNIFGLINPISLFNANVLPFSAVKASKLIAAYALAASIFLGKLLVWTFSLALIIAVQIFVQPIR
jgi:hypothetical protein